MSITPKRKNHFTYVNLKYIVFINNIMVNELFSADASTKKVMVLGVESSAKLEDLKILVNGTDISENILLKSVRIIVDKGE